MALPPPRGSFSLVEGCKGARCSWSPSCRSLHKLWGPFKKWPLKQGVMCVSSHQTRTSVFGDLEYISSYILGCNFSWYLNISEYICGQIGLPFPNQKLRAFLHRDARDPKPPPSKGWPTRGISRWNLQKPQSVEVSGVALRWKKLTVRVYTPRKLTAGTWKWTLGRGDSYEKHIICRFHVSFPGCTLENQMKFWVWDGLFSRAC